MFQSLTLEQPIKSTAITRRDVFQQSLQQHTIISKKSFLRLRLKLVFDKSVLIENEIIDFIELTKTQALTN